MALIDDFLGKVSDKELRQAKEVQKRNQMLSVSGDQLLEGMLLSLRFHKRKHMATDIYIDSQGKEQPRLRLLKETFQCPMCGAEMKQANWLGTKTDGVTGPFCQSCADTEQRAYSHEDGMEGDSRVYTIQVDATLHTALAVLLSREPDEEHPISIPRDPVTSLPLSEESDNIEDFDEEDIVF